MGPYEKRVVELARREGILRPRDLEAGGIPRVYLKRLRDRGVFNQIGRGLYALADRSITEHQSLAEACKRVPRGVVCLLSALRFHGLTTQAPFEVWLALDRRDRVPRGNRPPLRVVRMSPAARTAGTEEHAIGGVRVLVFGPAKTVADCFKFRNKIGLDVALEALREFLRKRAGTIDELWSHARVCRVANVLRPYLEALA